MATDSFNVGELSFYRGLFAVVVLSVWVLCTHHSFVTTHLKEHLLRSLCGTISFLLWFVSLTLIPLSTAMTLGNATPLCMAAIVVIYGFIKKRPTSLVLICSAIAGFGGVLMIFSPDTNVNLVGAAFALGSSLVTAGSYIQIKALSRLKEPVWRTVFYFSIVNVILGAMLDFCLPETSLEISVGWRDILSLLGMGACGLAAQLCVTRAFDRSNMLVSTILSYSVIVFGILFGFIFFGDAIDLWMVAGTAVIIVTGVISTMSVKKLEEDPDSLL